MQTHAKRKSFGLVRLGKRSVVTLGAEVKRELRLVDGDVFELCVEDGRIILEPKKLIPADQQWFWTEEWQVGEREAQAEIQAGNLKHFNSMEEFLTDLGKEDED
ncbi:AbrB family transcriptional regulator [Desulfosporosinus sp. HMP52]|uniref:AbrB/MazE/SpoVT family DNA-binding domain-containing protein n=1 Tax=Desulfosporosinus sp. HMP52 TaxID=1487923 RepID=UPI00051FCF9E|nr:AbrB/MazE/SpoVT family DNA-binding domain-containing protein [Desulfosporosinus sp. HMP52]KGK91383.1 AbrB family transcriptional regulator [Desulfosporosinus sp. HMP52]